ncbi:hypothetical protein [Azorhizobium doebereinerae]|uniref:hypothetical protein n=1 Tax=Azorhizobium doebereinerae TaxID=281091 RepID=UPI0004192B00|nr:hypothetical protein [Azorhizobium doebereinerae]
MRTLLVLASFACSVAAHAEAAAAAPILPNQDKPGAVLKYQALPPNDRMATLEAFTQKKISGAAFDTLDACTLRETTEADAGRAKLAKTIADCAKETGF